MRKEKKISSIFTTIVGTKFEVRRRAARRSNVTRAFNHSVRVFTSSIYLLPAQSS